MSRLKSGCVVSDMNDICKTMFANIGFKRLASFKTCAMHLKNIFMMDEEKDLYQDEKCY